MKERKVREYYDSFSQDYDNFYEPIQFQKYEFMQQYLTDFNNILVIDLGGGTALLAKYLDFPIADDVSLLKILCCRFKSVT